MKSRIWKLILIWKQRSFLTLLGLVVLASIGKTAEYYFYSDDYATLYNIQNSLPHPVPYHVYDILITPLYQLFGLQPGYYFILGIFSYFIASISVFYLIHILTKNKLIAVLSSLIFATGYIGLDQFTMMIVSLTNNPNIVNVSLTMAFFILWIDSRKIKYYFASILMYWFSLALIPFRAFPLLFFLPTIDLILTFKKQPVPNLIKSILFIIIRFIPFLLIAKFIGVLNYGSAETFVITPQNSLASKIGLIFSEDFLKELFSILGRFVLLTSSTKFSPLSTGTIFFMGI